ncbi:MAG: hypothetical protein HZA58_02635 [Acidimicrobiia bacterium]|nr:hypothetical protein [Acidimicrobiia bacterium]
MRRGLGIVLIVVAVVIAVLGVALSVQMVGHTEWWQPAVLGVVALAIGYLLVRAGRRMRTKAPLGR